MKLTPNNNHFCTIPMKVVKYLITLVLFLPKANSWDFFMFFLFPSGSEGIFPRNEEGK